MRFPSLRHLGLALAALLLALLLGAAAALALALQTAPSVPPAARPTLQDVGRVNDLLRRHDPRYARPGQLRAAMLMPRDIELLLAQGARRLGLEPRVSAEVQLRSARLRASIPLHLAGHGWWLNLDASVSQTQELPALSRLRVGALPLPTGLVTWAAPRVLDALGLQAQAELALGLVNRVSFTAAHQAVVAFSYPTNLEQRLADVLLSPTEQERLKAHAERLAQLTREFSRGPGPRQPVPLVKLLAPMFTLAQQRSAQGQDPALENRAVLLTLTSYINGRGLHALVPDARQWKPLAQLKVTLAGRDDTPKHYLVSAVLAIEGGASLSNAIGIYKEVADAQGGTGFSFNDLAADRAGTRFGLAAQRQAVRLQQQLAAGVAEDELLPAIADLPENMQDPEFQRRFGGVDGLGYQRLVADIEGRLDRLPLLAGMRPAPKPAS